MLKRYQVMIPDWLEDFIILLGDKYDLSLSEVLRVSICCWIIASVSWLYPNYKLGISQKEITKMAEKNVHEDMEREEIHQILSRIYFETRKVVEFRLAKEKKIKKR